MKAPKLTWSQRWAKKNDIGKPSARKVKERTKAEQEAYYADRPERKKK